eukprot:gene13196-17683_t
MIISLSFVHSWRNIQPSFKHQIVTIKHKYVNIVNSAFIRQHKNELRATELNDAGDDLKVISGDVATTNQYSSDLLQTFTWVMSAIVFASGIALFKDTTSAIEFISGYVLEQSLSVDNLFVFLILFDYFKIQGRNQTKILSYGIWGAIILRGLFIGIGAVALKQFHQVLLIFAAILFYSSFQIVLGSEEEEEEDFSNNKIILFAKKYLKSTDIFDGDRFWTTINGIKYATPMLLCLICVEFSDVVFAFDSIPAVFGVTEDPFIVFTSNIFAIGGLRSLYGVLSKAVSELKYLEKAVGIVLGVIATKITAEVFGFDLLSPFQSLIVVIGILSTGIIASLINKDNR